MANLERFDLPYSINLGILVTRGIVIYAYLSIIWII